MTKPSTTEADKLIGNRLKLLRQQHKISASALADVLNTSQQQVSRYERGLNRLSGVTLWELGSYFSVPLGWFFLDLPASQAPAPLVNDTQGTYAAAQSQEQLAILNHAWPSLGGLEREAMLKMLDTFLKLQ